MEIQKTLSESSTNESIIQIQNYKHHQNSVGNNLMSIQITTKYRYKMMRKDKNRIKCKVAIEEACKKHKIDISILRILFEHVHLIVDCPRTMSVAKLMQIIKGLSSFIGKYGNSLSPPISKVHITTGFGAKAANNCR